MDKMFIVYEDYLPDGLTVDRLIQLAENKSIPFTKENLMKIIDFEKLEKEFGERFYE